MDLQRKTTKDKLGLKICYKTDDETTAIYISEVGFLRRNFSGQQFIRHFLPAMSNYTSDLVYSIYLPDLLSAALGIPVFHRLNVKAK